MPVVPLSPASVPVFGDNTLGSDPTGGINEALCIPAKCFSLIFSFKFK